MTSSGSDGVGVKFFVDGGILIKLVDVVCEDDIGEVYVDVILDSLFELGKGERVNGKGWKSASHVEESGWLSQHSILIRNTDMVQELVLIKV